MILPMKVSFRKRFKIAPTPSLIFITLEFMRKNFLSVNNFFWTEVNTNVLLRFSICFAFFLLLIGCSKSDKTYYVGVSQCSEDIWRYKQNNELLMGSYIFDNIKLEVTSADDSDQRQIHQIQDFVDKKVDLLIVAPNSTNKLTAVLDKAYDSGIPIILFDRKTNSDKFTAFMGADNYNVGLTMGKLIAEQMNGIGTLVEITGLKGSSPAIERHNGFLDALRQYPRIRVISSELGDWTEKSGEKAMEEVLRKYNGPIDCLFGHNDRLAVGARKVAMSHGIHNIIYYGVDALPISGGGIELVQKGILRASYIYPTQGIELMRLAKKILEGESFERINMLHSAIVDKTNADLMQMQYKELQRTNVDIEMLKSKMDFYFSQVNVQRRVIAFFIILIVIIIMLTLLSYRSYLVKARLSDKLQMVNNELEARNIEQQKLYKQLEDMADARMVFFTNVGHQLRTPLTLITGPVEQLKCDTSIKKEHRQLVDMMHRNLGNLLKLVDEILDFRNIGIVESKVIGNDTLPITLGTDELAEYEYNDESSDEKPEVLVVDDNADIRKLLKTILQDQYRVILADNGDTGLKDAKMLVPDIVVSDVMMPVMDGLEMCRNIKKDSITCHIPVLMLTARTLEEHRVEGYAHGADAYLKKPFSAQVLLARISNLLSIRKTLRKVFAENVADSSSQVIENVDEKIMTPDNTFIKRLRDIIQLNLSNSDFNVERIGEEIGMSRVQLYRKVKALTGMSPVELLRKSRVEKGRHLLKTTDLSISEIAYDTGFTSPSYFAKCFKDEYAMTPGEVRQDL